MSKAVLNHVVDFYYSKNQDAIKEILVSPEIQENTMETWINLLTSDHDDFSRGQIYMQLHSIKTGHTQVRNKILADHFPTSHHFLERLLDIPSLSDRDVALVSKLSDPKAQFNEFEIEMGSLQLRLVLGKLQGHPQIQNEIRAYARQKHFD